jgi:MFS family permease
VIATLGLLTIVAYGSCYYAYGVLIEPIAAETSWPPSALGAIFSAVLLISGVVGLLGGRLFDRAGARVPFLLAASLGTGALLASSFQTELLLFAATYAGGCGLVGALGFYHVTQAAAARASPNDPARAIVWLTIVGALASPIYLPLTATLVDALGWRDAIRIEAATVAVGFLLAAAVATSAREVDPHKPLERVSDALAVAWRTPRVRAWVLATLIGGAAADIILVFQVSIMVSAGLSLATAATIAGLRGFAQLAGRLPLGRILRGLGAPKTLATAYLTAAVGTLLLPASGSVAIAVACSVFLGAAIGAISSVQGVYTYELVDRRHLGMLLGAQQAIFAIGGAFGPALAGILLQTTGSHTPTITITTSGFLLASAILLISARNRRASATATQHR